MISENLTHIIGQQIAADIQIESISPERLVVYMPFVYDDGDQCGVFMTRQKDNSWELSDDGESLRRASYSGINVSSESFSARVKSLTAFFGASQNEGVLECKADDASLTRTLFKFTQTCLEASWLPKMAGERKAANGNRFVRAMERIVTKSAGNRPFDKNWHHPVYDPKGIYPVDFHVSGNTKQLFLFGVPNKYACQRATIALQHYRHFKSDFTSVVVYDHEEQLPRIVTEQLNEVADQTYPRISENRQIRKYLSDVLAA